MKDRFVVLLSILFTAGCFLAKSSAGEGEPAHFPAVALAGRLPEEERFRSPQEYIRAKYTKKEYRIPMRDGVCLFTALYMPKDTSRRYPIIMWRTPYGARPYGEDRYPSTIGPSRHFAREGYIVVYQDVRGRYMSEGKFVHMTPHLVKKNNSQEVDESSDTYDTIDWLIENIPNHNGRVGMWGGSYAGFYAAAGMINAHPALQAVSPQAPIADWWYDDFHHHGAFFLAHSFPGLLFLRQSRAGPTREKTPPLFEIATRDGYQFYLDLGPLKNVNGRYYKDRIPFWNQLVEHPNYDAFWKSRNIVPHLKSVAPAVMTVGGWFDAEDLYGPLSIYRSVEEKNPGIFNILIMGPWDHGGWSSGSGERLGDIRFGSKTALFYQQNIQLRFFQHFLKKEGVLNLPEAYVFETGTNRWRTFDRWPPHRKESKRLYFHPEGQLAAEPPGQSEAWDEYVSDPAKPVPFTQAIVPGMPREYMVEDQRFAARRPDVLVYQSRILEKDLTLVGPLVADLWVSTSGTSSDWVVKLIDVFPPDSPDFRGLAPSVPIGGYQMMLRSDVIRGRFRKSREHPEPFIPNRPTNVRFLLQDICHTFLKGHRIMVQIQSSWFPLVDLNPQKYVDNIFKAKRGDFIKATQRVYRSRQYPSHLKVDTLSADSLIAGEKERVEGLVKEEDQRERFRQR